MSALGLSAETVDADNKRKSVSAPVSYTQPGDAVDIATADVWTVGSRPGAAGQGRLGRFHSPLVPLSLDIPRPNALQATASFVSAKAAAPARVQPTKRKQEMDGVVSAILGDGILITCKAADEDIAIKLPLSLVAPELRVFGQPIRLSLGNQGGIRTPIVALRQVDQSNEDEFEAEFKTWMKQR